MSKSETIILIISILVFLILLISSTLIIRRFNRFIDEQITLNQAYVSKVYEQLNDHQNDEKTSDM